MRPAVLFRAALFVVALAAGSSAVLADSGAPVAESCPQSPETRYFPVGTFGSRDNEFVREWYSKNLVAMEEPSLSCGDAGGSEIYRFLWLPAFSDSVVVRVFQRNDDYGLEAVMLSGPGGYDAGRYNPGHVSHRVTRALSRDEWQTVIARLEAIQFWQMTTTGGNFGEDGAMWILEARRNGRYHIVHRWLGTDTALRSVGRLFVNLANLKAGGP